MCYINICGHVVGDDAPKLAGTHCYVQIRPKTIKESEEFKKITHLKN